MPPRDSRNQLVLQDNEDYNKTLRILKNGFINIYAQDQTTQALDLFFLEQQGSDNALNIAASQNDTTIELVDSTGFVDGNTVSITTPTGAFYFGTQIGGPAANVITLDTPLDRDFLSGAIVKRHIKNMNVNGSLASPRIFKVGPVSVDVEVDITRVVGYLQDNSAMDDSKFGGLSPLTNGIVLRRVDGINRNIWNTKTNSDLSLMSAGGFEYTDKAPGGSFGARFRNSYAGQQNRGVTIRLPVGGSLELLVQDDLTGLQIFNLMAQGHIVDIT